MTNTLPYRYSPPVDRLLNYGDCRTMREWPNYLELGLTLEQAPELIHMIADEDLHFGDPAGLEVWAPVHAWRALGQLCAEEAVQPLVEVLEFFDNEIDGDEYVIEDLPRVFGMIGPAAIPALAAYLQNDQHLERSRTTAANGLQSIAEHDPTTRNEVATILRQQLEQFAGQDEGLNGFLISYLVDLQATEALPVIEQAFAAGAVDEVIRGDWEDVQIEFGLITARETPRPNFLLEKFPSEEEFLEVATDDTNRLQQLDRKDAKKDKSKRKQAKKMRKKNRKK